MRVAVPKSGRSSGFPLCRRLPSSQAARMVIAFASPTPLYRQRSRMVSFPKVFRLLLQSARICLISVTASSFVDPEPTSMANNSASVSADGPSRMSFSRGRSSSAHWLMFSLSMLFRKQRLQEAYAIANELDEGCRNGFESHHHTLVADSGVDEDEDTI